LFEKELLLFSELVTNRAILNTKTQCGKDRLITPSSLISKIIIISLSSQPSANVFLVSQINK
jgi:hypothetical protein